MEKIYEKYYLIYFFILEINTQPNLSSQHSKNEHQCDLHDRNE